jgi:hypothetical protein
MWEPLVIANHLDQSLTNQKQGAAVRSYSVHSSLAGAQLCCAFYYSSSDFNVQGHILISTSEDALRG